VKGKLASGVGSQYSHTTSERGVSSITDADAHTSAASSRLNWLPRRFKWTCPFRRKTNCGFCACAIRFRTSSNKVNVNVPVLETGKIELQLYTFWTLELEGWSTLRSGHDPGKHPRYPLRKRLSGHHGRSWRGVESI